MDSSRKIFGSSKRHGDDLSEMAPSTSRTLFNVDEMQPSTSSANQPEIENDEEGFEVDLFSDGGSDFGDDQLENADPDYDPNEEYDSEDEKDLPVSKSTYQNKKFNAESGSWLGQPPKNFLDNFSFQPENYETRFSNEMDCFMGIISRGMVSR
uniref:Uncharacterized protein n=1 Tax=Acrobeloides nanus TaxID=290746 RepID=A0A914D778_9BILA